MSEESQFLKDAYNLIRKYETLPNKEYLLVLYEGNYVSPEIDLINFMEKNGVIIPTGIFRSMHPSIAFISMAVRSEILRVNSTISSKIKGCCDISKIRVGKYGYGNLVLPTIFKGEEDFVKYMESQDIKNLIHRSPQLRRLLKKYCESKDIYFNEDKLRETLGSLGLLHDAIYGYYDADEEVLFYQTVNTYFEHLPKDISFIISEYIDEFIANIEIERDILSKIVSSLVSSQITSNGSLDGDSIKAIYETLHKKGYSDKLKQESDITSVSQYVEKMGGPTNLISSLVSVVVEDLSKFEEDDY